MFKVAALYHFTKIENCNDLREKLLQLCEKLSIIGGLIIAHEGINGTVAGCPINIDQLIDNISLDTRFSGIMVKYSETDVCPFYQIRI